MNDEQHVLHIREPDGSDRLVKFTGRIVEQTDGWDVYLTDDDRVVAHSESTHRAEIMTVEEARGRLPRFKTLAKLIGPREPEDL
jgi:hypothetical protein